MAKGDEATIAARLEAVSPTKRTTRSAADDDLDVVENDDEAVVASLRASIAEKDTHARTPHPPAPTPAKLHRGVSYLDRTAFRDLARIIPRMVSLIPHKCVYTGIRSNPPPIGMLDLPDLRGGICPDMISR